MQDVSDWSAAAWVDFDVTRAAAFEPRIRATVAWGAIWDYEAIWRKRVQGIGASGAPPFQLMFVTGTKSSDEALRAIRDFKVSGVAPRVTCPFLIVHGSDDRQVPLDDALKLYDALGSKQKELKVFDGHSGGAAHTQFDNHLPALHYVADWLHSKLVSVGSIFRNVMFYDPLNEQHGLPRRTVQELGRAAAHRMDYDAKSGGVLNVAPYSHFNICSSEPPAVMFCSRRIRDRRPTEGLPPQRGGNWRVRGESVTYDMREQMNVTSKEVPPEESEATLAGLDILPSVRVKVPRLAASPSS